MIRLSRSIPIPLLLMMLSTPDPVRAAANPKALIGSWAGKASGPQGAPPTGDILLVIARQAAVLQGSLTVKGQGGVEYSGGVSDIRLEKGLFSATVQFKLGESPLEVRVSGPLKGKTIEGIFEALSKGKKIGEGSFSVTRQPAPKRR